MQKNSLTYSLYNICFIAIYGLLNQYCNTHPFVKYFIVLILFAIYLMSNFKYVKMIFLENKDCIHKNYFVANIVLFSFVSLAELYGISVDFLMILFALQNIIVIILHYIKQDNLLKLYKTCEKFLYNDFCNPNNKKEIATHFYYFVMGLAFLIIGLIYLEIYNHQYFFLMDDNFDQFMPTIIQACRDFFEKSLFPEINPYQLGGLPTSSVGVYALTYPVTYLSYAISKYVFKNEYLMIDVFTIFHLILAYVLAFIAGHKCKLKPLHSALYAICYSLSGFSLVVVRSWYYMSTIVAFAPLLIILTEHLKNAKDIKLKHILLYGFGFGILVHAGNIQMWLYLLGFNCLLCIILYLSRVFNTKKILSNFFVMFFACNMAIPLIYVTTTVFKNIQRNSRYGWDASNGILSFLCPNYILKYFVNLPTDWLQHRGQIFYSGSTAFLFVIMLVLCVWILFLHNQKIDYKRFVIDNVYLIVGIFAFILCIGSRMYLWNWFHSVGPLHYFAHPLKMVVFVNLFLGLSGFIAVNRTVKSRKLNIIIAAITLFLMSFHLVYSKQSFCTYDFNFYEDIKNIVNSKMDLKNYRVFPLVPFRYEDYQHSALTMGLNFPTIYKISSLDSYDNNFENKLENNVTITEQNSNVKNNFTVDFSEHKKYLENYGVKYLFAYNKTIFEKNIISKSGCKKIKEYDKISVYELPDAKPLAYIENTNAAIPIELNSQGFYLNTSNIKNDKYVVIINMIWQPQYKAYLDGKEVNIYADQFNRMKIKINQKSKFIVVKYHSLWDVGIFIMLVGMIIFSVLYILKVRYIKNE